MNFSQLQHNALTKARIKIRGASTIAEAVGEMRKGVLSFVILRALELLILEGDNWTAVRHTLPNAKNKV